MSRPYMGRRSNETSSQYVFTCTQYITGAVSRMSRPHTGRRSGETISQHCSQGRFRLAVVCEIAQSLKIKFIRNTSHTKVLYCANFGVCIT